MKKSLEALKTDLAEGPHRSRTHRPARPRPGRLLRLADADQPGRQRHAGRRPHHRCPAVGEEDGRQGSRRRSAIPTSASTRPSQGDLIRVPMPALTEERRKELIKVVQARGRERPRWRSATCAATPSRTSRSLLKKQRDPRGRRAPAQDEIQKLTDRYIAEVDKMLAAEGSRADAGLAAGCTRAWPSFPVRRERRSHPQTGLPRHVAIIMDGNGRWAKKRFLPRVAGHPGGVEMVRATVRACVERGVEYLTLFAFSSENWRRPAGRGLGPDSSCSARRSNRRSRKLAPQRHPPARDRRPRASASACRN